MNLNLLKRSLRGSFVAVIVSLTFESTAMAEGVTLRVDAAASIYAEMFDELARTFEAQNPEIQISMDTSARSQIDAFQKTLRLAVVDDLPDVSFQGPNYLRDLALSGHIVPLDNWVSSDPEWTEDRYSPSVTRSTEIGGETMGLGVGFSFPIIYYNADLVSEALGNEASFPSDWDGILALAAKTQELHPEILGIFSRFESLYSQGIIRSLGGRLGDDSGGVVTLDDSKTIEGIRILQRIGALGQGANAMTGDQGRQAFSAGQIAILLDSSSGLRRFLDDSDGHFQLKTAPLPRGDQGELAISGFAVVMHTEDATRQEAAWRFMKFVAGDEGQRILGLNTGFVPANEAALQPPKPLSEYYASIPQAKEVLDSIPYTAPWYLFGGNNNERIGRLFDNYMERVVAQKITPDDAVNDLSREIEELIP